MTKLLFALTLTLLVALSTAAALTPYTSPTPPVLSAFHGDPLLPLAGFVLCPPPSRAVGFGGMPVVFSEPIDPRGGFLGAPFGLDPSSFRVEVLGSGFVTPVCATLQPATDVGERRTVLLSGDFGDGRRTRPLAVEVVKPVYTVSNASLLGVRFDNIDAVNDGPRLLRAERFEVDDDAIVATSATFDGDYCPANETGVVVKLTFSGGVTAINDGSLRDNQDAINAIQILAVLGNGTRFVANPFAVRDVDGDNHIDACFSRRADGVPLKALATDANVFFSPANVNTPAALVPIS